MRLPPLRAKREKKNAFLCAFIVIVVVWILLFFNIENGFLELYHYNYRPWCEWAFNLEIDRYGFF